MAGAIDGAVLTGQQRLAAVRRVELAIPAHSVPADWIARLAAQAVGAPMGMLTLVGGDDVHFAGCYGLAEPLTSTRKAPLTESLCPVVVSLDGPLVVQDATGSCDYADFLSVRRGAMRAYLGVPLRDRDGRTLGALAVADARERRWSDDELIALMRTAELAAPLLAAAENPGSPGNFLHAVLDNMHSPVAACDALGTLIMMNQAMHQAIALPDDGRQVDIYNLGAALHSGDGVRLAPGETPLARALTGQAVQDVDVIIKPPGAPARTYLANATAISDDNGRVTGAVVVLNEVTRQRRAERFRACELRVAEALGSARSLVDVGPELAEAVAAALAWPYAQLWLVDPVTDKLHLAGQWAATGLSPDASLTGPVLRGHGITGAVWADERPLWVPSVRDPRHPQLSAALAVPVHGSGVVGVLTCFADTHEQDRADLIDAVQTVSDQIGRFATRRHTADLSAQLDRTRDDFITLVGHQLRTPLTSILAYSELLLDAPTDEHTPRMLEVVHRNASTLTAVVDDLLDLAALQSGHATLCLSEVDLPGLVTTATNAARPAAEARQLRIDLDLPDELVLEADPHRLRQVLDNLVSNAVKYSRDGGTVAIRLTRHPDAAELSVADTGIGIPAEERDRLFTRFFRAGNVRHGLIPGTGLGLVITRTITAAHHGRITLTHHDPGITATVRLPLRQPER
ncbi:signal transduction histidine kinase [Actinokineospora baliensis]|uniref:ATP-binding protein n=1 Tax=Actinokineospora baliensis TaxID=547056 RepID=UPI0019584ADC|nr:ATP-binding protein [Actinokineospora baliensis]MBM7774237.1 signal transduction histidine kinase [Actinokineospora baliensis]